MDITAHAKINWDLRILGRRPDGYHEIDTVMVSIDLADRLTLEPAVEISMTCSDLTLPCDDTNLVMCAAKALAQAAGTRQGARIHLEKKVPTGGGLGGGSSDAAAVLSALNTLWQAGFSREQLSELAARLGSDIGFFLWGGWCRCSGRGEFVEPLEGSAAWPHLPVLLIIPPFSALTPLVYKHLNAPPLAKERRPRDLRHLSRETSHRLTALQCTKTFQYWPQNDLQAAACRAEPRLTELQAALERDCAGRWQMSGSGAVHIVLPLQGEDARNVEERLQRSLTYSVRVVSTTTGLPDSGARHG